MVVLNMKTILAKLIETSEDLFGYITYVFEILEEEEIKFSESKYLMCVRYPNWDHRSLNKGEVGYLKYNEVKAGLDTWYDGKTFVPYKYNDIQFLKFIKKTNEEDECIM